MQVKVILNGKQIEKEAADDMLLIDFLRSCGCFSVKRGCETTSCGACSVLVDGTPVLSCSYPLGRANGRTIETLEGLREEAAPFLSYFAREGADQCGFCNPGYVVNTVALFRENPDPTDEEILHHLTGNICRCTGYQSHIRALRHYLDDKKEAGNGRD